MPLPDEQTPESRAFTFGRDCALSGAPLRNVAAGYLDLRTSRTMDTFVAFLEGFKEGLRRPNHLLAAAPDMLEALNDCAGVLQSIENQLKGKSFAVTAVLKKARAAIAKAEG